MPKTQIQHTHDELATVLMTLIDQTIRGNHSPRIYQLDTAIQTLKKAIPNIQADTPYRFKTGEVHKLLDELEKKLHKASVSP